MQTVQILLEENAYGAVRPMEVAADAPVAALVPAIVEELKLPRTDLFGNKLVYMLRYPSGGPALPDDRSLMAAGVGGGAKLALDSYVMDGSVAILMQGRWTRRAFLALGGAAFAAGSLGFGYAAYRRFVADSVAMPAAMAPMRLAQTTTTQPVIPTAAKRVLVFEQHQRTVRSVTWSPGGNMLASGANDAQLLTWDLNGTVHVRRQQANAVRAVAWSPDGQQLAAAVANLVMFFNPVTGAVLAPPAQAHTDQVTALAWSPRQPLQVVSTGLDKRAIVWNATPSYMLQTVFTQHTTAVESASWAADGQTVATSSHGGAVRVWHAGNGQQTHSAFIDAQLPMRALSFASSGLLAVGGDDGVVRLWNGLVCQQQGQGSFANQCVDVPQRLEAHKGVVRALAWSPDARLLATGGDDGMLAIWYPAQAQTLLLRVHHDAPVLALAWSSSGKQVATASGNRVTIWELH